MSLLSRTLLVSPARIRRVAALTFVVQQALPLPQQPPSYSTAAGHSPVAAAVSPLHRTIYLSSKKTPTTTTTNTTTASTMSKPSPSEASTTTTSGIQQTDKINGSSAEPTHDNISRPVDPSKPSNNDPTEAVFAGEKALKQQNGTAHTNGEQKTIYNCIIIGSGPAGYSAGVYAGRALLQPILFEGTAEFDLWPGGQLTTTTEVENFLGHEHINGFDLTEVFKAQAQKNGCKSISRTITKVDTNQFPYTITDDKGEEYKTRGIIVATGATAKRLFLPTETKLWQHGISACAVCDGALPMFRKQPVAVIGGGDTAMEEATFLTKFASKVYVIHRRDSFRASKVMADRVLKNPKIEVIWDSGVDDVFGDKSLEGLHVKNLKTGEKHDLPVRGLFYAIGHKPNTDFLKDAGVKFDEDGYILTTPGTTKTSKPGIFAGGDVQDKRYRQAITAAGSGCMASLDLEHWLMQPESQVNASS